MLYNGGLRVSEAVALRWTDLLPDRASGIVTVAGKGGKTRQVRLSKGTWAELQSLRNTPPDKLSGGPKTSIDVDGHVFPGSWRRDDSGKRAEHLDSSAVLRIVRRAAKAAGIKGHVSPHFLRHSHASHAIERGCDLAVVRDSLGHSSLATTSRYVHARPDKSSGDWLAV